MKILISTFAVALALAFTGPAFAGDVKSQRRRPIAIRRAACGMLLPTPAQRKRATEQYGYMLLKGVGLVGAPFFAFG